MAERIRLSARKPENVFVAYYAYSGIYKPVTTVKHNICMLYMLYIQVLFK